MARIRSVHPDICESQALEDLNDAALERTFVRLWTYLDDQGRGKDDPRLIKSDIYPLSDSQTWQIVDEELARLEEHGLVIRWTAEGKRYIACRPESWDEYQHVQHPKQSNCPVPPGYAETDFKPKGRLEPYHSSGSCSAVNCNVQDCSGCPPELSGKVQKASEAFLPVVVVGEVDVVGVVVGEAGAEAPAPAKPKDPTLQQAEGILRHWYDNTTPSPVLAHWPEAIRTIAKFLRAGHDPKTLRRALDDCPNISAGTISFALDKLNKPTGRRDPNVNQRNIERIVGEMAGVTTLGELERGSA